MAYGKPGTGKWITLYANGGHVYMEVAGIRFDTCGTDSTTGSALAERAARQRRLRGPPPAGAVSGLGGDAGADARGAGLLAGAGVAVQRARS